ncbi:hypothetical protein P879_05575 [Paragonimus westermani]|uniref:Uncharacterized protein n=1 Tax=Paragonimus westermani TaxID=34504 RepID=A0A8T0DVM5_9TREM|nr:hypothetical protein P879_05575 [Paragonimus westermani]
MFPKVVGKFANRHALFGKAILIRCILLVAGRLPDRHLYVLISLFRALTPMLPISSTIDYAAQEKSIGSSGFPYPLNNSQTHTEESPSENDAKRLRALEVRLSQLARELATLDGLDVRQSRLDSKKAREQKLLDRLNKILDTASCENACIRILTDLVHLESESCQKIIEHLKAIVGCVQPYLDRGQQLLSSLSTMQPSRSDSSPDEFCHLVATTHFEHVARKLLSSQNAHIPEEFAHLLKSEDPNSIPSLLDALQHKLEVDRQSADTLMQTISQFAAQLLNQLDSLRTCFLTSCSQIAYDQSKPHGDRASADRLLASSAGLCDRQLAESLAAPCAALDRLAEQLSSLRQQSDLVFSI